MFNKRLFLFATVVTTLGSSLTNIALTYRYLIETNENLSFGLITYAASLASIIGGPVIGHWVDRDQRIAAKLPWLNFILAGLTLFFAASRNLTLAALTVFFHTLLALYESALLFKLLPTTITPDELQRLNGHLEQISSLGFIFAPLAAPFISFLFRDDRSLFLIDAATFALAGICYLRLFSKTETRLANANDNQQRRSFRADFGGFLSSVRTRIFLASLALYLFGFSAMAYSLAIVAKRVAAGSQFLYALPILAMFGGRIVAMNTLPRFSAFKEPEMPFLTGTLGAGILLFPLGFMHSLPTICIVEFLLGGFIALGRYGERNTMQLCLGQEHLGKLAGIRQGLQMGTKLASVPLISLLIWTGYEAWTTAALSLGYLTSAAVFGYLLKEYPLTWTAAS